MVTKRDDQPTDRVNIEQSASGRLEGRVLQKVKSDLWNRFKLKIAMGHFFGAPCIQTS